MSGLRLRPARAGEAAALSALALRSKGHWGYDAAFLELCRPELTLAEEDLGRLTTVVAERDGRVVGFAGLALDGSRAELDLLFVEPEAIGTGAGAALLRAAREAARSRGADELVVVSDPNAEGFYRAHGGERVGERPGVGSERVLPVLRLPIAGP
ncbi:MAG TPA: GNAT family N-acetyltransferase [Solirubrobacteraceae bacterium]|nr:GNAT family N-acetyltransferase [Solirubrobacteraceae bacterium]